MKRQYTDPQPHHSPNTSAMFSENHHNFVHPIPFPSSPLQHPNNSITALPDPINQQSDPKPNNNNNHDGASVETQRRTRGRPPGSKNKPKSPNPDPTRTIKPGPFNPTNQLLNHHTLEILNGADVIESIAKYSLRHNTSLRILHASGAVANAIVRQPNHRSALTFPGRFDILSLSAIFVAASTQSQIPMGAFPDVSITLTVPKGHVVGGFVVGPLMASGNMFVLLESLSNLTYHRLDLEEGENANTTSSGGGHSPGGGEKNGAVVGGGECGINVPLYSANFMPY